MSPQPSPSPYLEHLNQPSLLQLDQEVGLDSNQLRCLSSSLQHLLLAIKVDISSPRSQHLLLTSLPLLLWLLRLLPSLQNIRSSKTPLRVSDPSVNKVNLILMTQYRFTLLLFYLTGSGIKWFPTKLSKVVFFDGFYFMR